MNTGRAMIQATHFREADLYSRLVAFPRGINGALDLGATGSVLAGVPGVDRKIGLGLRVRLLWHLGFPAFVDVPGAVGPPALLP